ncbi:RcnB family protein [Rhizobium cauense]|uniref:RcnB family protein n=1 Tax=Rhizobium cauense TaxID=1166683 RepID=UPI001C6E7469|nr:RcnB family protein [Rhizobium cauense]MBW9114799.1 RcnB family protein [Rhizobium cauense]
MKLIALALAAMMFVATHSNAEQWREPQYLGYRLDRGRPLQNWWQHPKVTNYRRLGLSDPGPGLQWIRIENHFVLLSSNTGIIRGLVATR